jgi:hypothetical protein
MFRPNDKIKSLVGYGVRDKRYNLLRNSGPDSGPLYVWVYESKLFALLHTCPIFLSLGLGHPSNAEFPPRNIMYSF